MRLLAIALGLGLSVYLAGCSAVVGGPVANSDLPCFQLDGGNNPCPLGQVCRDGRCTSGAACVPECDPLLVCIDGECRPPPLEVCNDMDDDSDGEVDEGLRNDEDGDTFYTCDPNPTRVDCVDRPGVGGDIYPGAPERCDGYDNDCDPGTVDGSASVMDRGCDLATHVCAPPIGGDTPTCLPRMSCRLTGCGPREYCSMMTDRCVPDVPPTDCRMTGMECRVGDRCNMATGLCEPIRDLPIGEVCNAHVECASRICYPWDALGLTSIGQGVGRCGAPCCTHDSCRGLGVDLACLAPGTGARSCMPRSIIGVDADAMLCSRESDCPGGPVCRLTSTGSGRTAFTCAMATETSPTCDRDDQCASQVCNPGGVCTIACGSRADCRGIDTLFSRGSCAYYNRGGAWVTACAGGTPLHRGAGESCTDDGQCLESYCPLSPPRTCAATCCADTDCGAADRRCRPVDHFGWEMRCLPLPSDLM